MTNKLDRATPRSGAPIHPVQRRGTRRATTRLSPGTGSSNPSPSSGESGANRNWPAGTSRSSAEAGPGAILHRGTEGSNPPPSSGESVSALNPSAGGEESRGFAAVCSCMGT